MSRIVIRVSFFLVAGISSWSFLLAQPAFFRKDIPVGDRPLSVAVGDFNGDSKPDLIVGTWAGFYILLGGASGKSAAGGFQWRWKT